MRGSYGSSGRVCFDLVMLDQTAALEQIDAALALVDSLFARAEYNDLSDLGDDVLTDARTRCATVVDRIAPPSSEYRAAARKAVDRHEGLNPGQATRELAGVLRALRADIEAGYLRTLQELIHADLFSDFLEMAEHLLENGYKDAAAVLAGGVLEEQLRQLARKQGVPVDHNGKPKTSDRLNADLAAANVISKNDQKSVTAWQAIRNDAAHGNYSAYDLAQVRLTVQSIRDFLSRYPA